MRGCLRRPQRSHDSECTRSSTMPWSAATDAPRPEVVAALGRLLYLVHLAIILWWLLDKSPKQRATTSLMALVRRALPACALTLRLPRAHAFVVAGDKLFREALFDDPEPHKSRPGI